MSAQLKRLAVITLVAILAVSPALIFFIPENSQIRRVPTRLFKRVVAAIKQEPASFGLPAYLKIPKINVDATVKFMGITASGELQAPSNPRDVGWFRSGAQPGNKGSAVIDGHYGRWPDGTESVFDKLNTLNPGDKVYIEDEKGAVTTFVVRRSQIFDPNANTAAIFESNDGLAHLNLITCDGIWDKTTKMYSKRLVVFTDRE